MKRVTKHGIYIGNIREKTHAQKLSKHVYEGVFQHLTIPREFFIENGFTIRKSLYDETERYDAFIFLS